MVALVGVTGLTIDVGLAGMARQQLQNAADAAALSAAGVLTRGMDVGAATQAAVDASAANEVLGSPTVLDPSRDVVVGAWDEGQQDVVPWSPARGELAVRVTARRTNDSANGPVPVYFSMVGRTTAEISASAVVRVAASNGPRSPLQMIVLQEASERFSSAWSQAIDAGWSLFSTVQGAGISRDEVGFAAFNDGIKLSAAYEQVTMGLHHLWGTDNAPRSLDNHYQSVRGDTPSGYANPGAAVAWARGRFSASGRQGTAKVIILVSRGLPAGADDGIAEQYRSYAVQQADAAAGEGIKIHTVTLTPIYYDDYDSGGADFQFNQSLARNGGYALRTDQASGLRQLLNTIGALEVGKPHLVG
jgi:Flp pilus assembly protein TadG